MRHRAFVLVPVEGGRPAFADYHLQHRRRAADLTGLPFALPEVGSPYPRSSWNALQAAAWMRTHHPERFEAFDEALFRAFFEECRDLSDPAVLAALAGGELGYAPREEVEADHQSALDLGIHSIPSVVVGDEVLSGAVAYEEYRSRV